MFGMTPDELCIAMLILIALALDGRVLDPVRLQKYSMPTEGPWLPAPPRRPLEIILCTGVGILLGFALSLVLIPDFHRWFLP